MASCRATKDAWVFCSDAKLRATVISTILPEEMLGGSRMEGNSIYVEQSSVGVSQDTRVARRISARNSGLHTSLLSLVSRTATPASTLPTVSDISIVDCADCWGWR